MWRLKLRTRLCSAALTLALLTAPVRHSLAVVVPWIGPDQGDWNLPANWEDGVIFGLPNALNDEAAAISNDATAVLTTSASTSIAGLTLGQQANTFGGLRITNGGSLSVVPGVSESGVLAIGAAGQGRADGRRWGCGALGAAGSAPAGAADATAAAVAIAVAHPRVLARFM